MSRSHPPAPLFHFAGWLLFAGLAGLILAILCRQAAPERILFTNDLAISLAVGDTLLRGDPPLAGPPSHLGGRSIGPLYYYYTALALLIGGRDPGGAVPAMFAINLIALSLTILLWPLPARRVFIAACMLLVILASPLVLSLFVPWHGYFVVFPSLFFMVCVLRLMANERAAWALTALAATMCAHTSLTCLPLVVGLGGTACAFRVFDSRRRRKTCTTTEAYWKTRAIWLLTAALWLPPLWYEIFHAPNMLRVLFGWHARALPPAAGFSASLEFAARVFGDWLAVSIPHAAALGLAAAALIAAAPLMTSSVIRRWTVGASAAAALYLAALARVPGELETYYATPLSALFAVTLVLIMTTPPHGQPAPRRRSALVTARFAAIVLLLSTLALSAIGRMRSLPFVPKPLHSLQHAYELSAVITEDAGTDRPVALRYIGQERLIENAALYLAGSDHYGFMQYHTAFREVRSVRKQPSAKRAYVMSCPGTAAGDCHGRIAAAVNLKSCSTCGDCSLLRMRDTRPQCRP